MNIITLDNAINIITNSNSLAEINKVIDEVGRLTYTKVKDIKNNLFTSYRLANANANSFMIKVLKHAEARKLEIDTP